MSNPEPTSAAKTESETGAGESCAEFDITVRLKVSADKTGVYGEETLQAVGLSTLYSMFDQIHNAAPYLIRDTMEMYSVKHGNIELATFPEIVKPGALHQAIDAAKAATARAEAAEAEVARLKRVVDQALSYLDDYSMLASHERFFPRRDLGLPDNYNLSPEFEEGEEE